MLLTTSPPENTDMVGIDMIWNRRAISGFSSMLTLATVILSPCSVAISSSTGATILHGPHHSAQKSTSTGLSLPSTSVSNVASVTVLVAAPMVTPSGKVLYDEQRNGRRRHSRVGAERILSGPDLPS